MRLPVIQALLIAATCLSACGPQKQSKAPAEKSAGSKSARKCPDPDLRDKTDPCSPMYLTPIKKRFKRDSL